MKKHNPSIPILLREAQGTRPKVYARYEFGQEESKSLEGKAGETHEANVALADGHPDHGSRRRGEDWVGQVDDGSLTVWIVLQACRTDKSRRRSRCWSRRDNRWECARMGRGGCSETACHDGMNGRTDGARGLVGWLVS